MGLEPLFQKEDELFWPLQPLGKTLEAREHEGLFRIVGIEVLEKFVGLLDLVRVLQSLRLPHRQAQVRRPRSLRLTRKGLDDQKRKA